MSAARGVQQSFFEFVASHVERGFVPGVATAAFASTFEVLEHAMVTHVEELLARSPLAAPR